MSLEIRRQNVFLDTELPTRQPYYIWQDEIMYIFCTTIFHNEEHSNETKSKSSYKSSYLSSLSFFFPTFKAKNPIIFVTI